LIKTDNILQILIHIYEITEVVSASLTIPSWNICHRLCIYAFRATDWRKQDIFCKAVNLAAIEMGTHCGVMWIWSCSI